MNAPVSARHPALYLIAAMLIWGGSFAAMKLAVAVYDPILITFGRLIVAALIFLALWRWLGPGRYRRGDWKWLLLMALFEPLLYFVFEANALRFTSSAAAATVIALPPLSVALAAQWLLGEAVTGRLYAGVLVSVAGVVLLTGTGGETALSPNPWLGNTLEFLAMLCAVGYTLVVRRLSVRYPALFLTAVQAFLGGVLYLPLLPFAQFTPTVDWPALLAVLYLGAVVSVLAYLFYNPCPRSAASQPGYGLRQPDPGAGGAFRLAAAGRDAESDAVRRHPADRGRGRLQPDRDRRSRARDPAGRIVTFESLLFGR